MADNQAEFVQVDSWDFDGTTYTIGQVWEFPNGVTAVITGYDKETESFNVDMITPSKLTPEFLNHTAKVVEE